MNAHDFIEGPTLETIRRRKNELLSVAAKYDGLAARARAEAADYEAAERVWLRMMPGAATVTVAGAETSVNMIVKVPPESSKSRAGQLIERLRKPTGTPPMPDMIIEALTDAAGKAPLD